jgi:VWFA-related protein
MIYVTKVSDLEFLNRDGVSLTSTSIRNTDNPPAPREMQNLSGNFFSAFKDVAEATGGTVDSTTNVAASFKKAADASENYYLLYYSPKNYVSDGEFKEIKIKVKGQRYKISHRAGYIAN